MREFKRKREIKKRIYSKTVIVLLAILIIFILNGAWGIFLKSRQSEDKLENSMSRLDELRERREFINEQIEDLNNETGIEEVIRSKYSFAKEGENMIVIIEREEEPVLEPEKGIFDNTFDNLKSWFGF